MLTVDHVFSAVERRDVVSSGVFRHLGRHAGHDGRSDQSVSPSPAVRRRALVGKPRLGLLAVRVGRAGRVADRLRYACRLRSRGRHEPSHGGDADVHVRLPFYYAGIAITLVLTKCRLPVARVYASDLCGASLGCFLVLGGLKLLNAPSLILLCGAIGAMAGFFFLCGRDTSCASHQRDEWGFRDRRRRGEAHESAAAAAQGAGFRTRPFGPGSWFYDSTPPPKRARDQGRPAGRPRRIAKRNLAAFFCLTLLAIVNSRSSALVRPFMVKGAVVPATRFAFERWNSFSRVAIYPMARCPLHMFHRRVPLCPTALTNQWFADIDGSAGTVWGISGPPTT